MEKDFVVEAYHFLMGNPPTAASVLQGFAALLTIVMLIMAIVEVVKWGLREWALRGTLEPFSKPPRTPRQDYWS